MFYPNIAAERAKRKMSMDALAEKIGVTRKTIYNWESAGSIPQSALEKKETREKVRAGLGKLPHEQRLILVLRDVEGFSYQEIADTLKIELGTVKSRIYRARAHLAQLLTEDGNFSKKPASEEMKGR